MTLGEFRELTTTLSDDTEIQVCSSLDESPDFECRMDVSEIATPDFYWSNVDDTMEPIIVILYNPEKRADE